jgi:hypothetical protein
MDIERNFLRSTFTTYLAILLALISFWLTAVDETKYLAAVGAIIIFTWTIISFISVYFCNNQISKWARKQMHATYMIPIMGSLPVITTFFTLILRFTNATDILISAIGSIAVIALVAWYIWMLCISKKKP